MHYYTGLDISLKTTSICIMDAVGKIKKEMVVKTDPEEIAQAIEQTGLPVVSVALECGGMSHWMTKELQRLNLAVVCIDARKMSAAISIRANKTDRNDAQEIANALRTGYYKQIYQKADDTIQKQTLLTVRRMLIDQRTQTINCIKGILKSYGHLSLGSSRNEDKFIQRVKAMLQDLQDYIAISVSSLLTTLEVISKQVDHIDEQIEQIVQADEDILLLKTIPGVGAVTALTFKLEIDDPSRFKASRSVGAYVGMTPKQYSSGESIKQGGISKSGSCELRAMLCQSALCMMYNTKTWNRPKLFGLKIKKKHGHKKAIVALGRKLCVIMHRLLIDRKPFDPGNVELKEIEKLKQVSKRRLKKEAKIA